MRPGACVNQYVGSTPVKPSRLAVRGRVGGEVGGSLQGIQPPNRLGVASGRLPPSPFSSRPRGGRLGGLETLRRDLGHPNQGRGARNDLQRRGVVGAHGLVEVHDPHPLPLGDLVGPVLAPHGIPDVPDALVGPFHRGDVGGHRPRSPSPFQRVSSHARNDATRRSLGPPRKSPRPGHKGGSKPLRRTPARYSCSAWWSSPGGTR